MVFDNPDAAVIRAMTAIREEEDRRHSERTANSQRIFGHTGAHVRPHTLTTEEMVRLAFKAARLEA